MERSLRSNGWRHRHLGFILRPKFFSQTASWFLRTSTRETFCEDGFLIREPLFAMWTASDCARCSSTALVTTTFDVCGRNADDRPSGRLGYSAKIGL